MKDSVKVGIILNSPIVPSWIYRVVKNIVESEFAEIKLVVYNSEVVEKDIDKPFFYSLHEKIEQFIFGGRIDFNKNASLSGILQGVSDISIYPDSMNAFDEILLYRLDVILNFSSLVINQPGLNLSRYGVWSCAVENQGIFEGRSNLYWKVVAKSPVIIASIYCSNGEGFGSKTVIHSSWLATNFNSTLLNFDQGFELCSLIILRLIKGIYLLGSEYINTLVLKYNQINNDTEISLKPLPSNSLAIKNLCNSLFRLFCGRFTFNEKWRWFLMYKYNSSPFPEDIKSYASLIPPKDRFWADPFIVSKNNKKFIFIEELLFVNNRGHITLLELDNSGKLIDKETIIEKSYHMSYPFVFEFDNEYYMIPETSENRTIELYKSEGFPRKWNFVMNLMENVNAKDTTLFFYNNKWWLFTAINESTIPSDYVGLFLFYSDDLMTMNWLPHPYNPIVTDIRTARPGGKIFTYDNKIYRPSQDCSVRYGRAFNINQIISLSETAYEEVLISKTEANWSLNLKGTHTFNFDDNFSVIDVY
jgi:hypothetical protein